MHWAWANVGLRVDVIPVLAKAARAWPTSSRHRFSSTTSTSTMCGSAEGKCECKGEGKGIAACCSRISDEYLEEIASSQRRMPPIQVERWVPLRSGQSAKEAIALARHAISLGDKDMSWARQASPERMGAYSLGSKS